jgi:hypothetical protein
VKESSQVKEILVCVLLPKSNYVVHLTFFKKQNTKNAKREMQRGGRAFIGAR